MTEEPDARTSLNAGDKTRPTAEQLVTERGLVLVAVDHPGAEAVRPVRRRGAEGDVVGEVEPTAVDGASRRVRVSGVPGDPRRTYLEIEFDRYEDLHGQDCTVFITQDGEQPLMIPFDAAAGLESLTIDVAFEIARGGGISVIVATVPGVRQQPVEWPIWNRAEHHAEGLARYVATDAIIGRNLTPEGGRPVGHAVDADRALAETLFGQLARLGLDYGLEEYLPGYRQGQIIRTPEELLEDKWGTCLDLAVTYASMCLRTHAAPLIALAEDHAFVIVAAGFLEGRGRNLAGGVPLAGCAPVKRDGELVQGVSTIADADAVLAQVDRGLLIPVECTELTNPTPLFRSGPKDRPGAVDQARARIVEGLELIDVAHLHTYPATGPFPVPSGRRSIRRYPVSGLAVPELLPTQEPLRDELLDARGVAVVWADSGMGKSTVARAVVDAAPAGAAWFLDASSEQALSNSLASAERAARNRTVVGVEEVDRGGYAAAALDRLRRSKRPWIVVLDNADGDPADIAQLMPSSGPDRSVIVTTTNPEWESVPDVGWVELHRMDDGEVAARVGDELVSLAAGRPLLVDGFDALKTLTGADAGTIAGHRAKTGDGVRDELDGPWAYWRALREEAPLTEEHLRAARIAAYLPPDRVPFEGVAQLAGLDTDAAHCLLDARLFTIDADGEARLHRLFGEAIRRDTPMADAVEIAVAIVSHDATRVVLDRHADGEVLERLADALKDLDKDAKAPDLTVGRPLHALASTLELRGDTAGSAGLYKRVLPHVVGDSREERSMRADALHGIARRANQQHRKLSKDELDEAVEQAREARRLRIDLENINRAGRHRAIEGLLKQHLARFPVPGRTKLELLEEARDVIEEAHEQRLATRGIEEIELARSQFNLAGINIALAKVSADPATYLNDAELVYKAVAARRRRIYSGTEVHPHIAACINGAGVVNFERARLLPSTTVQRATWLRAATELVVEALSQRTTLDGPDDRDDATKSSELLAKIALARAAAPARSTADHAKALKAATNEFVEAGIVLSQVAPLRADADSLAWIEAWSRSKALEMLVVQLGGAPGGPADLDERLADLDTFFARWDFRGGRASDLGERPRFRPAVGDLIAAVAAALGIGPAQETPEGAFDHVVVLGGAVRTGLAGPSYVARLLAGAAAAEAKKPGSGVTAHRIVALGGHRALDQDEIALALAFTERPIADELEAIVAGTREAFDSGEPDVAVVAVPSAEPDRAATATDAYAWLTGPSGGVRAGDRVLVVTSHIDARLGIDAVRLLGVAHGAKVEWAGMNPGAISSKLKQEIKPYEYLQEISSMIQSLRRLRDVLR